MNPAIYPILATDAGVTALVPTDRIYPVQADQDTARPYIVFYPSGISTEMHFHDRSDTDYDRVSIDCWAEDGLTAQRIAEACRNALETHGYLAGGLLVDYEPDTKLYRQSFDWSLITAR